MSTANNLREIPYQQIVTAVRDLCIDACHNLPQDVLEAIQQALQKEESPTGRHILQQLLDNARTARLELLPLCQDTGLTVVFVQQGNSTFVAPPADRPDATLIDAINEGVEAGYTSGFLRKSIVDDPVHRRTNTGTNCPAVIHHEFVPGRQIKLSVVAKGGGCENRSQFAMLKPSDGQAGVENFVVSVVENAGADACPPFVVGVGIGGDFEKCCQLSKQALLRPLGSAHPDPFYATMEKKLLERINNLGIGPQGFGGRITALAVLIETHPCHIASLPVAVNIECHSHRHKSVSL